MAASDADLSAFQCFRRLDQVVLMLSSFLVYEKSRKVCIKARSTPASLALIVQVTKHSTVKWPIQWILRFEESLRQ